MTNEHIKALVTDEEVVAARKQLGFTPADDVRLRAAFEAAAALRTMQAEPVAWRVRFYGTNEWLYLDKKHDKLLAGDIQEPLYAIPVLAPAVKGGDIEKQAWECDKWPAWLHTVVERTNEVADRLDMSAEQAHAYAALSALATPPVPASVPVVKGLDRAPSDQTRLGWTLPVEMLSEVSKKIGSEKWDAPTIEVIEIVMLEAERRILAALSDDHLPDAGKIDVAEECARIAESYSPPGVLQHMGTRRAIAAAIRARFGNGRAG